MWGQAASLSRIFAHTALALSIFKHGPGLPQTATGVLADASYAQIQHAEAGCRRSQSGLGCTWLRADVSPKSRTDRDVSGGDPKVVVCDVLTQLCDVSDAGDGVQVPTRLLDPAGPRQPQP